MMRKKLFLLGLSSAIDKMESLLSETALHETKPPAALLWKWHDRDSFNHLKIRLSLSQHGELLPRLYVDSVFPYEDSQVEYLLPTTPCIGLHY